MTVTSPWTVTVLDAEPHADVCTSANLASSASGVPRDVTAKWHATSQRRQAHATPVYCVHACPFASCGDFVATAGGPVVTLYRLDAAGARLAGGAEYRVQSEVPNQTETFYACKWMLLSSGSLVIVAAGSSGYIHSIASDSMDRLLLMQGHGGPVNVLECHPEHPDLLLTGSADESVRLWNARHGAPLAVFAGDAGHVSEVLSVAWSATRLAVFVSSGMDDFVRIWSLKQVLVALAATGALAAHGPAVVAGQSPVFATSNVHHDFVDCIVWHGDLLLSKSVHDEILLWRPRADLELLCDLAATGVPARDVQVLRTFTMTHCNLWYVRFGLHVGARLMACGNTAGRVAVWSLEAGAGGPGGPDAPWVVNCRVGEVTVRCVEVVSRRVMVAGLDDGRVCVLRLS